MRVEDEDGAWWLIQELIDYVYYVLSNKSYPHNFQY